MGAFINKQDSFSKVCMDQRIEIFTTFPCAVFSLHGRCHVQPWLIELSGIVLSCFTLSHKTIFKEASSIRPEDAPVPILFKGGHSDRGRLVTGGPSDERDPYSKVGPGGCCGN